MLYILKEHLPTLDKNANEDILIILPSPLLVEMAAHTLQVLLKPYNIRVYRITGSTTEQGMKHMLADTKYLNIYLETELLFR